MQVTDDQPKFFIHGNNGLFIIYVSFIHIYMQACKHFNDEGNCVESCPSQKYIEDSAENVILNPDYRVTFDNQCLRSCPGQIYEHKISLLIN